MTSLKDKIIYKLDNINFVEASIVGYTIKNNIKTYRILYNEQLFDASEDEVMSYFDWIKDFSFKPMIQA